MEIFGNKSEKNVAQINENQHYKTLGTWVLSDYIISVAKERVN